MGVTAVYYNGKVYTGTGEGGYEIKSAVALSDDKILAVGTDEEMLVLADEKTEKVDCGGNTVLPGLCDAHCHGSSSGDLFFSCDISGISGDNGPEELVKGIQQALREFISAHPEEKIIRAKGFNQMHFPEDRRPTRQDLDAVCNDKPLVIVSFCLHALWVNTRAIELAGLNASTPQPATGSFETEADGYPSGMFHEMEGVALIKDRLPGYAYTVEDYKRILLLYQEKCVTPYGVTLVQDCMLPREAVEAYKELAKEGKLHMRARAVYTIDHPETDEQLEAAAKLRESDRVGDLFAIDTVKYFLEGFFAMLDPYEKEFNQLTGMSEDYCGELMYPTAIVEKSFEKAMQLGLQIHLHAMGDASVCQAVDCLYDAQKAVDAQKKGSMPEGAGNAGITSVTENAGTAGNTSMTENAGTAENTPMTENSGLPDHADDVHMSDASQHRNVVAHVMLIPEDRKKKMGEAGLIASLQPRWMVYDNDVHSYFQYIGQKRSEYCYPDRSLSDAGAIVAYGTDFPVTPPPNPYHGIQCAVTRQVFRDAPDYEPNKGLVLGPDCDGSKDMVSLEQAIQRSSRNGAYQMFLENVTGSIIPGMSAELVLLDRDLAACPVDEIYSTKVLRTVFKGQVVYRGESRK